MNHLFLCFFFFLIILQIYFIIAMFACLVIGRPGSKR